MQLLEKYVTDNYLHTQLNICNNLLYYKMYGIFCHKALIFAFKELIFKECEQYS